MGAMKQLNVRTKLVAIRPAERLRRALGPIMHHRNHHGSCPVARVSTPNQQQEGTITSQLQSLHLYIRQQEDFTHA